MSTRCISWGVKVASA